MRHPLPTGCPVPGVYCKMCNSFQIMLTHPPFIIQYAKETLLKMDDTKALISLYVEDNKWDDAFLLLHAHPGERGVLMQVRRI